MHLPMSHNPMPQTTLQTARCNLNNLRADDMESVVRLNMNPEVRRYLGGPVDEQWMRAQFPQYLTPAPGAYRWAIREKQTGHFIGIISLDAHHDGVDMEISYQLFPEWWEQGYAKESVQVVITYALTDLGLPRIIAETQTANSASCRLLERIGMRLERTLERFGAEQAVYMVDGRSNGNL